MASPTTDECDAPRVAARWPRYVFVGAFGEGSADGSTGGQLYACTSLLATDLGRHVTFDKIDSTMKSVPPPPVRQRVAGAGLRLARFARAIARPSVDGALIFTSARLSFLEKGLMALLASGLGKRVVLSPRSGLLLDDYERSSLMRWFIPLVLRNCDVVICQGEGWREVFREHVDPMRTELAVIPNWLNAAPYRAIAAARVPMAGPATFLYLGWLEPYKGILDLIEAVKLARDQLGGARVIVCGSGSAGEQARREISEAGLEATVDLRGWVTGDDKLAVLAEADVLVLPSHREGMPNALLEAMASGLAPIACRVGGVPDVIEDGNDGLLVAPGRPAELAEAMIELHRSPQRRDKLGREASSTVAERHAVDAAWPRIWSILAPRPPSPENA